MSSAVCFNLDQSKILSSGNGLKQSEKTENAEKKKKKSNKIF